MFKRLFGLTSKRNRQVTAGIYSAIVAAARQPGFYSAWGVPDTPLGRYEMLCLHMFLFLHRMKGLDGPARDLAQEVTDEFFLDVDHSLRELGIGDLGIPKRVKKLARMFYGRAETYGKAVDGGDRKTLAAALLRNVRPGESSWAEAESLAAYAIAADRHLRAQRLEDLLEGRIGFTSPEEAP